MLAIPEDVAKGSSPQSFGAQDLGGVFNNAGRTTPKVDRGAGDDERFSEC